jgi:hypothetical protein
MLFSTIVFLSYYYYFFNFQFFFHDTNNTRLKERYGDDPSIHLNLDLDLQLEDRMVDSIELRGMVSLTLRLSSYKWPTVFQPLDAHNRFRALKLRSSRRFWTSKLKIGRPILVLIMNDSVSRWPNSANCYLRWDHIWVMYVLPFICLMI